MSQLYGMASVNSFTVRRGHTGRSGKITLSRERGNLSNDSNYKSSGFQGKAVDIRQVGDKIVISTKDGNHANSPKHMWTSHDLSMTSPKDAIHQIEQQGTRGYRGDLRKAALARYSTLRRIARNAEKKKITPVKRGRKNLRHLRTGQAVEETKMDEIDS